MAHHLKTMLRIVNISGATSRFGLCKCVVSVNEDVNLCINYSISKIANKTLVYRIIFHTILIQITWVLENHRQCLITSFIVRTSSKMFSSSGSFMFFGINFMNAGRTY